MVGIAVLGCGRIGRIHARNLARHPRARLRMVFDVLAEAAQQTATELGSATSATASDAGAIRFILRSYADWRSGSVSRRFPQRSSV